MRIKSQLMSAASISCHYKSRINVNVFHFLWQRLNKKINYACKINWKICLPFFYFLCETESKQVCLNKFAWVLLRDSNFVQVNVTTVTVKKATIGRLLADINYIRYFSGGIMHYALRPESDDMIPAKFSYLKNLKISWTQGCAQ